MTSVEVDYLDGDISVDEEEPSTPQEVTALIGEQGMVKESVNNLRYRNKYPRVYKKASKDLEAILARDVKSQETKKDGTIKKILISETDHLRACFKKNPEKTTEVITQHALSEPLFVKGERAGGGGKISQAALDASNGFFALGDETVEEKVGIIESMVPGYKVGRDAENSVTPESLARGIQALNKYLMKQAQSAALGALGQKAA